MIEEYKEFKYNIIKKKVDPSLEDVLKDFEDIKNIVEEQLEDLYTIPLEEVDEVYEYVKERWEGALGKVEKYY